MHMNLYNENVGKFVEEMHISTTSIKLPDFDKQIASNVYKKECKKISPKNNVLMIQKEDNKYEESKKVQNEVVIIGANISEKCINDHEMKTIANEHVWCNECWRAI